MINGHFKLLLFAPLAFASEATEYAEDPCKDAEDVNMCHRRLAGLIATFPDEQLRSECGALDHFPPMPGNGEDNPKPPPQFGNGNCSTAQATNECYEHIRWAHDQGKWQHPEWYGQMPYYVVGFNDGELDSASFDDFQMYFHCNPFFEHKPHNCGAPVCGRSCPEAAPQEWEDVKIDVDNQIDATIDTHSPEDMHNWCHSNDAHHLIKWSEDQTTGTFDCGLVYAECQANPNGADCYDVANTFCNEHTTAPLSLNEMCSNADGQDLNNLGYDDTSLVVGGGRRLLKYRIPWWRWAICSAARMFSLALFGGVGLYAAENCDLFMTRLVIHCLVMFGGSPMSVICMAGWMAALTRVCQALVGAITLAIQQYFMWMIRCGPKPNYDTGRRLLLDLPGNPNHVAFADVPFLPEINLPELSAGRRLLDTFRVNVAEACGCLSKVSEDQSNALVSVVGDGLKDLRSKCQAQEDNQNSSDCAAIVTRARCQQVEGCRFDKATKSCMDVDEGNSVCGAHQRRVNCQDEPGCVWEGQRCVQGEAKSCNGLNKKQCKRSDSCQWKRKEKLCMD